jgi:hypothetical protein
MGAIRLGALVDLRDGQPKSVGAALRLGAGGEDLSVPLNWGSNDSLTWWVTVMLL